MSVSQWVLFCQFLRSKNLSASVSRKLRQFLDVHSFSYMKQLVWIFAKEKWKLSPLVLEQQRREASLVKECTCAWIFDKEKCALRRRQILSPLLTFQFATVFGPACAYKIHSFVKVSLCFSLLCIQRLRTPCSFRRLLSLPDVMKRSHCLPFTLLGSMQTSL